MKGVSSWNRWREKYAAIRPDLSSASLKQAQLGSFDLRGVNLEKANLEGADLRNARMQKANLFYARLKGANLEGADLRGAFFYHADLKEANLKHADLSDVNLEEADLSIADLSFAKLDRANMLFARLAYTKLEGSNLSAADYVNTIQQVPLPSGVIEVVPGHLLSWFGCQYPECDEVAASLELVEKGVPYRQSSYPLIQKEETAVFLSIQVEAFMPSELASDWCYAWREDIDLSLSQGDTEIVVSALRQGSFSKIYEYLGDRWQDDLKFYCPQCQKTYCSRHYQFQDISSFDAVLFDVHCPCGNVIVQISD